MARFTISLGRRGFCDALAARFSPLAGDPTRPSRICRICVFGFVRGPRHLPALHDISEDVVPAGFRQSTNALPTDPFEQVSVSDVLAAFRKGIEEQIGPDDHESHFNLGVAYFEMGLLEEAIEEFEIAAADLTRGAECRGWIGLCFRGQGHNDRAIQSFSSAIKTPGTTDHQKAAFFFELAVSLDAAGERMKASKMLQQVRALDPDFPRGLTIEQDPRDFRSVREAFAGGTSRDAYVQTGESKASSALDNIFTLESSLRIEPENVRARITLAELCVKVGRVVDAAHHYFLAAAGYREAGATLRAVASYEMVLRLGIAGLMPRAHAGLADLCDEMGTAEGERHRRESQVAAPPPTVPGCSFCGKETDFFRPPARGETTTICAPCLLAARDVFVRTPTA